MSCKRHCTDCRRERQYNDYFRTVYGECRSLRDFNRAAWLALDLPGIVIYGFQALRAFWRVLRGKP